MDISETDDISIVGEEAHIVAREISGPRGNSPLTVEQRDKYDNLILMCSVHHKNIDDLPEKYTVEILNEYKSKHERWVKENLNLDKKKQREDEIYASYVDEFMKLADVENWEGWTSFLFGSSQPSISAVQLKNLYELNKYIISRIWSRRYPELERAFYNFKNILNDLLKVFDKYRKYETKQELIWTEKFYHIEQWDPKLYEELSKKYDYHVDLVIDLTLELTRAINHLFDKIREFLLASFRIKEGVVLISIGPDYNLNWTTHRVEYSKDEKKVLYPVLKEFMNIRSSRNFYFGKGISEDYFHSVH